MYQNHVNITVKTVSLSVSSSGIKMCSGWFIDPLFPLSGLSTDNRVRRGGKDWWEKVDLNFRSLDGGIASSAVNVLPTTH